MKLYFDKILSIDLKPEINNINVLYSYEGIYEIQKNKIYKRIMKIDMEPKQYTHQNYSYIEDTSVYNLEIVNKIPFDYYNENQTIYTYKISDNIKYIKIYDDTDKLIDHYFYSAKKFNDKDLLILFNSYYSK